MKILHAAFLLFFAVSSAPTLAADADADVEAGLAAVRELGDVNGTALACTDRKAAARARELMLAHAPKTARFGAAYEESTQAAFAAQTGSGKPCPDALDLTDRLNRLAVKLADTLPLAAK